MKRNESLVGLSKDHHHGLLLVWKLREGVRKKIEMERIAAYAIYSFRQQILPHFEKEEQYLFPILEEAHPLRMQALAEHNELRALIVEIGSAPREKTLMIFAHVLESHIRFEERELFQYLQDRHLSEVNNVATEISDSPDNSELNWSDTFWNR